jgi:pimeloyl-ACP methyl ester carboxylesterase
MAANLCATRGVQERMPRVDVRGRRISYELCGARSRRLVLIAGTGLSGAFWKVEQIRALTGVATCLLVDNAGTGGTDLLPDGYWLPAAMADDVLAMMDSAGWETAHIAGHSLGSAIAQEIARRAPERVSSLSLHSTWRCTKESVYLTSWLSARRATAIAGDAELWRLYSFFLVSPVQLERHGLGGGALGRLGDVREELDPRAQIGHYDAGLTHDGGDLATLRIRTLVTVGEHDLVTLPRLGRVVAESMPDARLHVFADAGHLACVEVADEFNAVQSAFLTEQEPDR